MDLKKKDMYDYIIESKPAVKDIIDRQDEIFTSAVDYFFERDIEQIYLIGSGTSYHAAVAAKPVIEKVLGIKIFVSYPTIFKDELIFNKKTLVIGVSHAGYSASTIYGLNKARNEGLATIAVTAEKGVPVENHADCRLYIEIGDEHVGPKTKGYIGSIVTLVLFGLRVALKKHTISEKEFESYICRILQNTDAIPEIARVSSDWYLKNREELIKSRRIYIIGYENCLSAMMEGTLKLSESVRYSVQGYELEEFMHGIYHCIDKDTYIFYIASAGQYYERILRLKTYFENERTSHNFLISNKDDGSAKNLAFSFTNDPDFAVLQYIVPLQVVARKLSLDLGIDCDVPSDPHFHEKMQSYINK